MEQPSTKRIAYKFRVDLTPQQTAYLRLHWRTLRWLWNTTLRMRLDAWERVIELYRRAEYTDDPDRKAAHLAEAKWYCQEFESVWSQGNLGYQRQLTEARALWPELASRSCDSEQMLLRDLDGAWQRWRDAVKSARAEGSEANAGRPQFNGRFSLVSIASGKGTEVRVSSEGVRFPGLPRSFGLLRAIFHRPVEGNVKQARIVEGTCGDWYVVLSCEIERLAAPTPPTGSVGIDRGVKNLAADSAGRTHEAPPAVTESEAKMLLHLQRSAAHKEKGSRRWRELMQRKARIEARVSRRRDHLLHRIANEYTENFGLIVLEALKLKNMTASAKGTIEEPGSRVRQKAGLNKAILRAAPGRLAEFLKYKAAWRGGLVVEVDPAYTSQTCAACGHVDAASRPTQAQFCCVACGHEDHADVNAAKNILARGLAGAVKTKRAPVKRKTVKKERKAA